MLMFTVKVPVIIEQRSNYDKYDFECSNSFEFEHSGEYQGAKYVLCGKDPYFIEISELRFAFEKECMDFVEKMLEDIMYVTSLVIQRQNANPKYTHWRLSYLKSNWDIKMYEIDEKSTVYETPIPSRMIGVIRERLSLLLTTKIDFKETNRFLDVIVNDVDFRFLLGCYYRAVASTDMITKYYNAFTFIEFIESKYSGEIQTSPLVTDKDYDVLMKCIDEYFLGDTQHINRVRSRVGNEVRRATVETRAEKLQKIINDHFGIFSITTINSVIEIDCSITGELIKARNSLFHGKDCDEKDIAKHCVELILLIEAILMKWTITV